MPGRIAARACLLLSIILALLFVIQLAAYWLPKVGRRLARRGLGAHAGGSACRSSVRKIAIRWLSDPPHVWPTDSVRVLFVNAVRPEPRFPHTWALALLAKGRLIDFVEGYEQRSLTDLLRYAGRLVRADGSLRVLPRELDDCANGELLIFLHQHGGGERFRVAADELANYLLARADHEGILAYRMLSTGRERFVDSIGLFCPFLALYGRTYANSKATDVAIRQMRDFMANGMEPRSGLPYHGYLAREPHPPVGIVGWGRGTGWLAIGLIDTLASVAGDNPDREFLSQACLSLAKAVAVHQRPDGGWGTVLPVPDFPFDSSATAMIGYFLSRVRQLGLSTSYEDNVRRAVAALIKAIRRDGVVDGASGETMSLTRHSDAFGPAPYAQGLTLALLALEDRAGAEGSRPVGAKM